MGRQLCDNCNRGIGYLQDNPFIMINGVKYIKTNKNIKRCLL